MASWNDRVSWSERADRAAHRMAQRVDDTTGEPSARAAAVLTTSIRLLRWPTAVVLAVPVPFIALVLVSGLAADGAAGVVVTLVGVAMAAVSGAAWLRRARLLAAVSDPEPLAAELRTLANLTGRVDDTGRVLQQIGGGGGVRVLGRLRGLWNGTQLPARWMDQVGDLPRARWFAPPRIGTTVLIATAAGWLVPISIVIGLVVAIGAIAGSI